MFIRRLHHSAQPRLNSRKPVPAGMLFSYFPFGGEGGGDGALIAVIDEGEGLLRHKDTLQVRGVEPELDIGVRVGRRRYIEVVEAVMSVVSTVIFHCGSSTFPGLT